MEHLDSASDLLVLCRSSKIPTMAQHIFLYFIHRLGITKTTKFRKLVLLPYSGELVSHLFHVWEQVAQQIWYLSFPLKTEVGPASEAM